MNLNDNALKYSDENILSENSVQKIRSENRVNKP